MWTEMCFYEMGSNSKKEIHILMPSITQSISMSRETAMAYSQSLFHPHENCVSKWLLWYARMDLILFVAAVFAAGLPGLDQSAFRKLFFDPSIISSHKGIISAKSCICII